MPTKSAVAHHTSIMDFAAYLDRIGYSGPVAPTLPVLRTLHKNHLYSVPFENLDIALNCEIKLDLARIFDKIVRRNRGGFCYEQNALFDWALRELGFDLDVLSARVARADHEYGPEFDHMLLLVRVEGEPWLADVGFGDSFVEPLRLAPDEMQADRGLQYQIVRQGDGYLLRRRELDSWKNQYLFTLAPRALQDFAPMCVYQQTSPESSFTQRRVCSRATPSGRITLTGTALIITENGHRTETPVGSTAEFEELLHQHFGIALSGFPPPSPPQIKSTRDGG